MLIPGFVHPRRIYFVWEKDFHCKIFLLHTRRYTISQAIHNPKTIILNFEFQNSGLRISFESSKLFYIYALMVKQDKYG
jgi:hypothetical protein